LNLGVERDVPLPPLVGMGEVSSSAMTIG